MHSEEQWQIKDYCECGAIIFEMDGETRCPDCSCNLTDEDPLEFENWD
jgi:uncharacterized Zn finger protein (UPF0148 family)